MSTTSARAGTGTPKPGNAQSSTLPEPDPRDEADDRRDEPHHERLEQHRADDLSPLAPIARSRPELPRALGDQDRERVEDDEATDEQTDAGEAEQQVVEDRQELVDLLLQLGRELARTARP